MTSSSGIFSTGEKKCMPSTRSGRRASRGDVADRDGGGVAGEDGVGPRHRFDFRQDLALELEILEHRLDHQVGAAEAAVVRRRRRAARSAARTADG